MDSYIYVVSLSEMGPVKIGYSASPERRLKQLQTGQASKLSLNYTEAISGDRVRMMEKILHETNRHRRISGEWYDLTVEDAILEVKHAMIRYEETLEEATRHKHF